MSRDRLGHRRSRRRLRWLFSVLALATAAGAIGVALLIWQQGQQVQILQDEVAALHGERKTMEAQLVTLQRTATVTENRLATLEADSPPPQPADGGQEMAALQTSFEEIQTSVSKLQSTVDGLSVRLANRESTRGSEAGEALPSHGRLNVARQRQSHNLSCESSAASMVAQYHGVSLSEADVLAALPLNDDPHVGFRGNVDGPTGGIEDYGVYAGPIMDVLSSQGLEVWPVGGGLDGIRAAIVRGNPVVAWVTYNCLPSTPTTMVIDGNDVTLVPYQHVVVITGYSAEGVWANDPWDGQEDFYPNANFKRAMGYFGDMAIEVAAP
jgi:uncharacterized protein YvpB